MGFLDASFYFPSTRTPGRLLKEIFECITVAGNFLWFEIGVTETVRCLIIKPVLFIDHSKNTMESSGDLNCCLGSQTFVRCLIVKVVLTLLVKYFVCVTSGLVCSNARFTAPMRSHILMIRSQVIH